MITSYPVPVEAFSKEEAPFVYTEQGEWIGRVNRTERRDAGTIACFAGEPLKDNDIARAWENAGYIARR
jgi:hypothetical protein